MTAKYRAEYRRARREAEAQEISRRDREALELMRALRPFTYGGDLGDSPEHLARRALHAAIDGMAEAITGDREYFHAKHHSLCQGYKPPPQRE